MSEIETFRKKRLSIIIEAPFLHRFNFAHVSLL